MNGWDCSNRRDRSAAVPIVNDQADDVDRPGNGRKNPATSSSMACRYEHHAVAHNWICEVFSPGTARLDRHKTLAIYAREGVPARQRCAVAYTSSLTATFSAGNCRDVTRSPNPNRRCAR